MERQRVTVPKIPQAIRERIEHDVAETGASFNDLVTRILGQHFGIEVASTGRKPRDSSLDPLILKMPEELWFKMRVQAARSRATMRGLVIETLAKHYELELASPSRRPRTRGEK